MISRASIERWSFLLLLAAVTLAFLWVVQPVVGAILWSVVAAILFAPLNDRLLSAMPGHRNVAAALTLLAVLAVAVIPAVALTTVLVQELAGLYSRIESGALDLDGEFARLQAHLPGWAASLLHRAGLADMATVRAHLAAGVTEGIRSVARGAMIVGQGALGLSVSLGVMLYLSFFLFRDGRAIYRQVEHALPLSPPVSRELIGKFAGIVHATVKTGVVVGIAQGTAGGLIFWLLGLHAPILWGAFMAVLSLLPAVGAALVWFPVAVYMLLSGAVVKGVILLAYGSLVISVVDNILRPHLVGKDTKIPDYVVLATTVGGLELFGFNGFVLGPMSAAMFLAVWQILARTRPPEPEAHPGENP